MASAGAPPPPPHPSGSGLPPRRGGRGGLVFWLGAGVVAAGTHNFCGSTCPFLSPASTLLHYAS